MSQVYTAGGGTLLILAIIGALVLFGSETAQTAAERDALQSEIETRERVEDAMDRPDDCAWPDRLRGAC